MRTEISTCTSQDMGRSDLSVFDPLLNDCTTRLILAPSSSTRFGNG